jgi:hypothetical protein
MSGIVMIGHRSDAIRAEEGAPPPHKRPTFQPSNGWPPSCSFSVVMASPERNISAVDQRLVGLEDEATRLRAEVAALQEEIRWLTGQDDEPAGWLSRGWVRASLLLTAVGMVVLVSLPYLLHLDASGPTADPTSGPAAAARPSPAAPRAAVAPAQPAPRDEVPVPAKARVRAPQTPEPARVLDPRIHSAEDHAGPAPRPRPARERRTLQPSDAVVVAPPRGESP